MSTTSDLSKFGWMELKELELTLRRWREQGLPEDFNNDEVMPMMNVNSGHVFLTNSDYQVAMINGDKLESFYNCPECGHEGFLEDIAHEGNGECMAWLRNNDLVEELVT